MVWRCACAFGLGTINTRTGNYRAKYLFYRYDDKIWFINDGVVAMILPVTGFRLECAKINRVESDKLYAINNHI